MEQKEKKEKKKQFVICFQFMWNYNTFSLVGKFKRINIYWQNNKAGGYSCIDDCNKKRDGRKLKPVSLVNEMKKTFQKPLF